MQEQREHTRATNFGRRSVIKAAAWSVPAVSLAAAAPAFADSTTPGVSVEWGNYSASLATLGVLGGSTLNLSVLPTGPTDFKLHNNSGAPVTGLTAVYTSVFTGGLPLLTANVQAYSLRTVAGATPGTPTVVREAFPRGILWTVTQSIAFGTVPTGTSTFPVTFDLAGAPPTIVLDVITTHRADLVISNVGSALGTKSDDAFISKPVGVDLNA